MNINSVILVGRLTKDPEVRYTPNGTACCQFNLAVGNGKDKDGEERPASFPNIVVWDKQAENLAKYQKKGNQIAVDGRLQTRSYENEKGVKVYVTEVVARQIQFLDNKKEERPLPPEPEIPTSFKAEEVDSLPVENFNNQTQFALDDNQLPF